MTHHKKYRIILGLFLIVVLSAFIFFMHKKLALSFTPTAAFLCPDDYKTSDEATSAMNAWMNNFYDAHPDATITDLSNARYQFYIDHNCTAALARAKVYAEGKADSATMARINAGIQDTLKQQ